MKASNPDSYATWDAAYVLGSLPPAERREYEEHLAHCPACLEKVAEISVLPGLLAAVKQDAPALQPVLPPAYAVFAGKVRRQRRARWVAAAAGAALIAGAGTLALTSPQGWDWQAGGGVQTSPQTPAGTPISLNFASTGQTALTASGTLLPTPWGTTLSWTCSYASGTAGYTGPAKRYELVVLSRNGDSTVAASWLAGPGETARPVATSSLAVDDIAGIQIRLAGASSALLQATP
jgi:RNA polymerase sigma-70 factor (ECF subfamily)